MIAVGRRTGVLDLDLFQVRIIWDPPGFAAVGAVAVGEQHDWDNIPNGQSPSLLGDVEAIGWAGGRDHRHRAFAISSEDGLEQVGLFGFRREARGWTAALDVDDNHGQLGHDRQSEALALERDAW